MPRIAQETVEQVAAASDIVTVIGSYFPLKRAGTEYRAICPFHQEKTPSFFVNPAKQSYYCHGCGAGGAVFQFLMQYENIDFPESVRRLAARAGISILEEEVSPEEEARQNLRKRLLRLHFEASAWFHRHLLRAKAAAHAREYLKSRGINIETAKRWQIGFAPNSWDAVIRWATGEKFTREELVESGLVKLQEEGNPHSRTYDRFRDRLMFPIHNDIGEVVAFSGRILDPQAPGGKYINSPETQLFTKGNLLFGLHQSKRFIANARQAVVLEGQLDLITAFEAGIQNVVAPQGTALTDRHASLLHRFADSAILFFDADPAGEKAAERALEVLFAAGFQVRIGEMPSGEDPDSMIRKFGAEAFRDRINGAEDFFDFQINRKLSATESNTTAGRVGFARKMSHFISLVPDLVLRDTLISRLAVRLRIPRDTLQQMVRTPGRSTEGAKLTEEITTPQLSMPRHDLSVICKSALVDRELLLQIRQQPWNSILKSIPGAELLSKIFESGLDSGDPASIAAFFASLPKQEASILSLILANKELNEQMGLLFWTRLAAAELQRRKRQIEAILRLSSDDPVIQDQATHELKEVLDLESCFTDISRLSSPAQ
ncbi:MAG TPA: DNA primase [Chthoniobacterales bacterium]|jgi:DNA primase|nr:DNA primase [Chthoniobacterales bacterium]